MDLPTFKRIMIMRQTPIYFTIHVEAPEDLGNVNFLVLQYDKKNHNLHKIWMSQLQNETFLKREREIYFTLEYQSPLKDT